MNLAARYSAITYVAIVPTGILTQPPSPEFFPSPFKILCLNPENPTPPLDGQMFRKFSGVAGWLILRFSQFRANSGVARGSGGGVLYPEKGKVLRIKRGATGVLDVWLQLTA